MWKMSVKRCNPASSRPGRLSGVLVVGLVAGWTGGCGSEFSPFGLEGDSGGRDGGGIGRRNDGSVGNDAADGSVVRDGSLADGSADAQDGSVPGTVRIGPAGGDVSIAGVSLRVPSGALTETVSIVVERSPELVPDEYAGAALSPRFRFKPEGLTFAVPATVEISLSSTNPDAVVYWSTRDGSGFEVLTSSSVTGRTVAADVDHFSDGFAASASSSPCGPGGCALECTESLDCPGQICRRNVCVPSTCANQMQDGSETDVDCGGACAPCFSGSGCQIADDCLSDQCDGDQCVATLSASGFVSCARHEDCGGVGLCRRLWSGPGAPDVAQCSWLCDESAFGACDASYDHVSGWTCDDSIGIDGVSTCACDLPSDGGPDCCDGIDADCDSRIDEDAVGQDAQLLCPIGLNNCTACVDGECIR